MAKQRFKATLKPAGPGGAWTGIFLTEAQSAKLGKRGRVPIALTVNGHPFKAFSDGLAYTHKKDFVSWITEAKRQETKDKRLAETMRLLKAGTKWKDK